MEPPKVTLLTTGNGSIRFNPNLYNNGRVCLSLLGTWQGEAATRWTSQSSICQLFTSIQTLVLSGDPYFNEPGTEHLRGTERGQLLNQGYENIARFATVKYAIAGQLRDPAEGLQKVIR